VFTIGGRVFSAPDGELPPAQNLATTEVRNQVHNNLVFGELTRDWLRIRLCAASEEGLSMRGRTVAAHVGRIAAALAALLAPADALAQASASDFTSAVRLDPMGRTVGTIAPDPDGSGPLRYAATRTTYDAAGRPTSVEKGELSSWQSEAVAPSSWSGFTVFQTVSTTYDAMNRKLTETLSSTPMMILSANEILPATTRSQSSRLLLREPNYALPIRCVVRLRSLWQSRW